MIEPGPGLQSDGLPEPKLQTICLLAFTSIARLLNWSVIRMFPGRLNPVESIAAALLVARPVTDAPAGAARPTKLNASTASAAPGPASRQPRLAVLRTGYFITCLALWAA